MLGAAAMGEAEVLGGLAGCLWGVANSPPQTAALYRLLGDYCHAARNRLNSLKLELYMARRAGCDLGGLEGRYMEVEMMLEQLQAICRPIRLMPIHAALGTMVNERRSAWESVWGGNRGARLRVEPPPGAAVSAVFDPIRLGQGLDGLVAWRGQSARAGISATIRWRDEGRHVVWEWQEPPGEPPAIPTAAAMAVPMLAKVVVAHGGTLAIDVEYGFHLRLHLPVTIEAPPALTTPCDPA